MALSETTSNPTFSFSLLTLSLTLLTIFITYWFYKIVIHTLLRMQFYRKQGLSMYYCPIIGNNLRNAQDFKEHGDSAYFSKFGDKNRPRALCTNLGCSPLVVLYDAALIKEFYLHPENYIRDPAFLDVIGLLIGKGLLIVEGSQWKAQRKVLSNSFNFEFLKSITGDIQKIAKRRLREQGLKSLRGVEPTMLFQEIAAEVMGSAFFGEKINDYHLADGKPLKRALADILLEIGFLQTHPVKFLLGCWVVSKGVTPRFAKTMRQIKEFRKFCTAIIEQKRKVHENKDPEEGKKRQKDMVETLFDYQGEGGKLTNEKIIDEFITFYSAGTDTTSNLLTNCICQLVKYPEAKAKLIREIKEKYNPDKEIDIDQLNNFDYLTGFIKETLRTLTPAPGIAPRKALKDHKIGDLKIKKDDLLFMNNFYPQYNSKYFSDPETFDPERWISKNPMSDPYAFTPFSAGPRNCIGQHLAMNEAKIILCEFFSMYDFEAPSDFSPRFTSKFMYAPADPVLIDLKNAS